LWQPSTRTASAYMPRLDESESSHTIKLEFDATEPTAPFVDRESDSRFGVEGRAVSGPLKGRALKWIDSVQCRWFASSSEYPQTLLAKNTVELAPKPSPNKQTETAPNTAPELVLVDPAAVTLDQIRAWRTEGFSAVVAVLDEEHPAEAYMSAAAAAKDAA